jgi:acyl-CoA synthetase (AMP-forming)/AMP-acid ligase II
VTEVKAQRRRLVEVADRGSTAVVCAERSLTWGELERRARQVANALGATGIGPGEAWAVLLHNRVEWPEIAMGNARAGIR